MAYRKQNVFHGNANNELKNGKSYVPAIDKSGHDSESLVAFKGGFGLGNAVYDKRQGKVVYSFEVLDALPGTIMLDSDYVVQAEGDAKSGVFFGTTEKIDFDSETSEFILKFVNIGDSDALTSINVGRSYIWSDEFGTSNDVIEGYVTSQPDPVGSTVRVKPTSSAVGWKSAMERGSTNIQYDPNNKLMARGKTINDDKHRYADADSDFMFSDNVA